jgi:hypothetical protein
MRAQSFIATLEPRARGGTTVAVAFDPDAAWGPKDRHYVAGTIGGQPMRGTIEPTDGRWEIHLGPAWCRDPSVASGATVEVVLQPEGPQVDDLPAELRDALRADPVARRRFESLATFYRKGFADPIVAAKQPATRERRAGQVMEALRAGRRTYR